MKRGVAVGDARIGVGIFWRNAHGSEERSPRQKPRDAARSSASAVRYGRKVARKKCVAHAIKVKARKVSDTREGQVGRAQGEAYGTQGRALGPAQGQRRQARGAFGDPQHARRTSGRRPARSKRSRTSSSARRPPRSSRRRSRGRPVDGRAAAVAAAPPAQAA